MMMMMKTTMMMMMIPVDWQVWMYTWLCGRPVSVWR